MKTLKITALALALAAFTFGAKAQTKTTPTDGLKFSIGVDGGIPTGKSNDLYNWNIGGSAQLDIPVASKLFVTVNAGYDNIFGKKNVNVTTVTATSTVTVKADVQNIQLLPAKAGLKYFIADGFYVQGEAGAAFLLNKKDVGYDRGTAFIYAPQVGVVLPVSNSGSIDLGVRYEASTNYSSIYNGSSINFIGLRAAYAFKL